MSEREPYDWIDGSESWSVGHVGQLNSIRGRKKKHPVGFAPPASPDPTAGRFPVVPRFDLVADERDA